jgi:sugar (pentulose or hexulose) kinase
MLVYAVDLGTTNVKVVLFDDRLERLAMAQAPAAYDRDGARVEFDPVRLFDLVIELIHRCAERHGGTAAHQAVIALTGQAESLVLTDGAGTPVRPAMSWLDDRATAEADELAHRFGASRAFAVTGEPEPSATWPAAKLRWLARHEPDVLDAARDVLMVKDDLLQRFTGEKVGEATTRGFTYFYDVSAGTYWEEMLDFCSVRIESLPTVVRAGADVGTATADVLARLPPAAGYHVNAGALDHFCAMIGTGSYAAGVVSESAGTVLSLSMLAHDWAFDPSWQVSFHPGIRQAEILLFNGVDSGGVALEWYRREALSGMPYAELEDRLRARGLPDGPIFLPYLTGRNPPDFFADAKGAFLGIDLGHDRIDLAYSVEEGIAHLLRRNVEYLARGDAPIREIVSTGGGAASAFWSQLKADICGVDVLVPNEQEATCRGAAVLALVEHGLLGSIDDAATPNQPAVVRYRPSNTEAHTARYRIFEDYLDRLFRG